MSCDACKRIPVLTGYPCRYCGRLNVEAQLAAKQLQKLNEPARADSPQGETATVATACGPVHRDNIAAQPETGGDEARVTHVWVVTETYRYEDERGGVPVAVFASESSAKADCERRREAPDRSLDYDYDVIEWDVAP